MTEPGFTPADLDAASENLALGTEDLAATHHREILPEQANVGQQKRRRQKKQPKISTTIRLSPEVIEYFKGGGAGWQARIDAVLRERVVALSALAPSSAIVGMSGPRSSEDET